MSCVARADEPLSDAVRVLVRDHELTEALAVYDEWLTRAPDDRAAILGRARVLGWLGRHDEALTALGDFLVRAPDDTEARVDRARVLGWLRRFDEAEAEIAQALARAPDDVEAHLVRGDLAAWQQRPADAEHAYAEARRLAGEDPRPALRLARVLRLQGKEPEARAAIADALRIAPADPDALAAQREHEGPPGRRRLRLDADFRYDHLRGSAGDWWHGNLQISFLATESASVRAGLEQYRRFGENDTQWMLGTTLRLPHEWQIAAHVALGMNIDVVARQQFEVELSRRLSEHWTSSLRYRRSRFPGDVDADMVSPGVEWAASAHWAIGLRYHFTRLSGGRSGHAGEVRVALLPDARISPTIGAAYGSEAFAPSSVGGLRSHARVLSASAGLVWHVREDLGLRFAFEYEDLAETHERHGVGTGFFVRF